jgi:hypothetical protein
MRPQIPLRPPPEIPCYGKHSLEIEDSQYRFLQGNVAACLICIFYIYLNAITIPYHDATEYLAKQSQSCIDRYFKLHVAHSAMLIPTG